MRPMRWSSRRATAVLILCNVLWAGSYVAGKEALRALSPVELNGVRFAIAGLVFLPLLWRARRRVRVDRRDLPRLALLCLLGFVLNKAAEYTGLALTTASDTALLIAGEGVFTAILAWLILREDMRRGAVGGLLIGAVGVYVVVGGGLHAPQLGGHALGDMLVVLALLFEALYTVLGKAALSRYSGLVITAGSVIGSLVVWAPATAVDALRTGLPHMDGGAWAGTLYLALAGTVAAYAGWFAALRYADATTASVTLFLQPLVGTALAILLLGERPSWSTLAGGVCIMGGVWLASRAPSSVAAAARVEAPAG